MAITLFLPPDASVKLLKAERLICHKKSHMHNSPVQNMATFDINGHFVEVTQDGASFAVQIDEHLTRFNLTIDQVNQIVETYI